MKQTLTTWNAADLLAADENANWTRRGAYALVSYLEEIDADCGVDTELDVVGLRCDFSEYKDAAECLGEFWGVGSEIWNECLDADGMIDAELAIDRISGETTVIQVDAYIDPLSRQDAGRLIVQAF